MRYLLLVVLHIPIRVPDVLYTYVPASYCITGGVSSNINIHVGTSCRHVIFKQVQIVRFINYLLYWMSTADTSHKSRCFRMCYSGVYVLDCLVWFSLFLCTIMTNIQMQCSLIHKWMISFCFLCVGSLQGSGGRGLYFCLFCCFV